MDFDLEYEEILHIFGKSLLWTYWKLHTKTKGKAKTTTIKKKKKVVKYQTFKK